MKIRNKKQYFKEYNCEKELKQFCKYVFKDLELKGWKVKKAKDSYCNQRTKTITLAEYHFAGLYLFDAKIFFLHEVAHIFTYPKDHWHGDLWQNRYKDLVFKFIIHEGEVY